VRSKLETVVRKIRRHGFGAVAYQAAVRGLGAVADFRILRGVAVAVPEPTFLACPYEAKLIDERLLRDFARDPANEMSREFLDEALARGDQCYGIVDRGRLAAYGWYAFGPTPIGIPGVILNYRHGYVYMYKGFTHEDYRGQRLHAIGMTRALAHYLGRGYLGIVSYVESVNFDSLKSCFRMGYSVFGTVYVARLPGGWRSFATPGCSRYDFRVEASAGTGSGGLIFGK
jgi:hypothetical protein